MTTSSRDGHVRESLDRLWELLAQAIGHLESGMDPALGSKHERLAQAREQLQEAMMELMALEDAIGK